MRSDPAVRRELLLETAEEILAIVDPSKVTLKNLADAAGVSRPLVYAYFKDRAGLLAAVDRRRAETVDAHLAAAVAGVRDPAQRAEALLAAADRLGLRARAPFVAEVPVDGIRFPQLASALGIDPARADVVGGIVLGAVLTGGDRRPTAVVHDLATGLAALLDRRTTDQTDPAPG